MTIQDTIKDMWIQYYSKDVDIEDAERELLELKAEWKNAIESASTIIDADWEDDQDWFNTELSELFEQIQDEKRRLESLKKEKIECLSFGEWSIGEAFVFPIEYRDDSGLTRKESRQLRAFLASIKDFLQHGHVVWGGDSEFEECEVSGLRSNCTSMQIVLTSKE